jgi:hypothetical protein
VNLLMLQRSATWWEKWNEVPLALCRVTSIWVGRKNSVGSSETSVPYEDRQTVSVHLCWLLYLYTKLTKLQHTGRSVKNSNSSSSTRHIKSGSCTVSLTCYSVGWGSIQGMLVWDLGRATPCRFLSGSPVDRVAHFQSLLLHVSDSSVKVLQLEKSHPSLKFLGKRTSSPCSSKWGCIGQVPVSEP